MLVPTFRGICRHIKSQNSLDIYSTLNRRLSYTGPLLCDQAPSSSNATNDIPEPDGFPDAPEPTMCCGSGCGNCIWIQYADAIADYYERNAPPNVDGKTLSREAKLEAMKEQLDRHVDDPNLKAYLWMEIQSKA